MNNVRKLFSRCMAAIALAAFALPGNAAPEKIFSVAISNPVTFTGSSATLTATIKNATPNGNSSINSLTLRVPQGSGITIVGTPTANWPGQITSNPTSVSLSNMAPLKPNQSFVLTLTADFASVTTCSFTWTASAWTGSSFSGDTFRLLSPLPTTTLAPATFEFSSVVTDPTQPGYAAGERGAFNKDGSSACVPAGATFSNNILEPDPITNTVNSVRLQWNTASQPGAAFKYTVTWKPEYVSQSTGLPTRKTKVAWQFDGSGNPITVVGRACLSPNLPTPYGTLNSLTVAGASPIDVNLAVAPADLPAVPFPITVGDERMTVTAVSGTGTTWAVTRNQGGTAPAGHSAGTPVASNPLPLDGAAIPMQMQMCIADEGWSVVAPGAPDCPTLPPDAPTTPLACVLYSTTVLDVGDGFMIRD